jgi:hypothetical protein
VAVVIAAAASVEAVDVDVVVVLAAAGGYINESANSDNRRHVNTPCKSTLATLWGGTYIADKQ